MAAWHPQVGPQTMALESKADILGYGGAAGGGKSDLLIGAALTRHRRSIIFRREHVEVRDLFARTVEAIDQAHIIDAKINRSLSTIYVPTGDHHLEFGGVKNPDDWRKHRGRARDLYGFDEATEFDEIMIRSLIGWNRTTIKGQRCRVILGFNPPGLKFGQWLIGYFAPWLDPKHPNPAQYGELRWFTTINSRDIEVETGAPFDYTDPDTGRVERLIPLSRTFIKAVLDDNAYLRDTNYRAALMGLPEPLRSQLLYGSFEAEETDDADQCIPTRWIRLANDRWLSIMNSTGQPDGPLSAVGADPSRGGANKTAFAARIGTWFDYPTTYQGVETDSGPKVIALLAKFVGNYRIARGVPIGMDVIGVGTSPLDIAQLQNMNIIPMHGGEKAPDEAKDRSNLLGFANMRAYWYWSLREALDPEKGENLALPPDRELTADLCAVHYYVGMRGIQIEAKEDIAKRLGGRSPDKGDAVVYCAAVRPFDIGYQSVGKRTDQSQLGPARTEKDRKKRGW
jgi:Terminase large subunit, T4likevirus-type, N-terminal